MILIYPTRPTLASESFAGSGSIDIEDGIPSTEAWGEPALVSATATGIFIDGVSYGLWKKSTFKLDGDITSGWTATFDIEHSSGTVPTRGDEAALYVAGSKRFGGYVRSIRSRSKAGSLTRMTSTIKCGGYESILSRIAIEALFTPTMGGLPGILMYELFRIYLQPLGFTKNGDAGPAIILGDQLFQAIYLKEAMDRVRDQSPGMDYWITMDKEFVFSGTNPILATANAPFIIQRGTTAESGDAISPFEAEWTDANKRNRQLVVPLNDLKALRVETSTGDGSTTSFATTYVLHEKPIVRVGGVKQIVTELGTWPTGWQAYYVPEGIGVFFNPANPPANLAVVQVSYLNPFKLSFIASDPASIAADGPWDAIYQSKDVTNDDQGDALAQGLLDMYNVTDALPQTAEYNYNNIQQPAWLTPGMVITVNWTNPNVSANAVVEKISSTERGIYLWRHKASLRFIKGNMDEKRLLQAITNGALRNQSISPPMHVTVELDVTGVGNVVGVLPGKEFRFEEDSVFTYWRIRFQNTFAPQGGDFVMDALLDGVSIFPTGSEIRARAGITDWQSGIEFVSDNLVALKGQVLTFEVLQIGSVEPGTYGLSYIGYKTKQASH